MSIATSRPTTNVSSTNISVEPPSTGIVQALSDDIPDTYAQFIEGSDTHLKFTDPTVPAGAVVKEGQLRVMARYVTSASGINVGLNWRMADPDATGSNVAAGAAMQQVPSNTYQTYVVLNDDRQGLPHVTPTDIGVFIHGHVRALDTGPVRISALYFDTIYLVKPVVTITAPTGTVTGDTTPTISWVNDLDTHSDGQSAWQVKLFTASQSNPSTATASQESLAAPGGESQWAPPDPLADGTWHVYVRVAQTVNGALHWSDWGGALGHAQFSVSINRPSIPSISVTPDSPNGRIQIQLSAVGGAATTSKLQVQVSDNGTVWEDLRTTERGGLLTPVGASVTAYDYEGQNGALRYFRARALHAYPEGYAASVWTTTQSASWTSTDFWVKNLADPSLNMVVVPKSQPSATRVGRLGLFQPLGAKYPIAVLDKRSSATGQFVFVMDSDAARNALEDLCDKTSVVLIQAPSGVQDWPDRYCVFGDYERERAFDFSFITYSYDSVQWTEVARP